MKIETQLWKGDARLAMFGPGPWLDEPDRIDWQHDGVACFAHRQPDLGHWCGYVGVKPGHPWHGKDYKTLDAVVDVHGGLTYADDNCRGFVLLVPDGVVWWLGFDCGHAGDVMPLLAHRFAADVYRDRAYIVAQVEFLAQEVRAARPMTLQELIAMPEEMR